MVSVSSFQKGRLHSLDALRGLDMLCIIGLDGLMRAVGKVFPDSEVAMWLGQQFSHVSWEGCRVYDLIFPLFVFISGMSMAFSIGRRLEEGMSRGRLSFDVVKRSLLLVLIGLVMNGLMDFNFTELRFPSVLGLIGVATGLGGLAVIWLRDVKGLVLYCAGVLLVVGCLQVFGGDFTRAGNVNSLIDKAVLPGRLFGRVYDPEGVVCMVSASFLAVAGYLCGVYMKRQAESTLRTAGVLLATGAIFVAAGSGLAYVVPVIKAMWTPSFNLVACGWGLVAFALVYVVVDVWRCNRLGGIFEVIGFNALAIYVGQEFISFGQINKRLFGGIADLCGVYAPLVLAFSLILLKWWILYGMKRANFRVRIG